MGKFSANHNLLFTEELIDKYLDKWEWHYLSSNPGISWTDYLIVKYKDKLDWNGLSENTSIVWSELLIDKHIDFWNWHLLAGNFSINWNEKDFWEKYENRIYYNDLATNLTFNWSTQFIQEFDLESWEWEELSNHLSIWDENKIEKFTTN